MLTMLMKTMTAMLLMVMMMMMMMMMMMVYDGGGYHHQHQHPRSYLERRRHRHHRHVLIISKVTCEDSSAAVSPLCSGSKQGVKRLELGQKQLGCGMRATLRKAGLSSQLTFGSEGTSAVFVSRVVGRCYRSLSLFCKAAPSY